MSQPLKLKRRNAAVLCSIWPDGFESCILFSDLRDACPCAHCIGEEVMGQKVYIGRKVFAPGMNELVDLKPVGNYAIQALWKDGHDSGIYTFDLLRQVFVNKKLSAETLATIDDEIHR
ncbi:MAG: DUF971 domain-containing protein [Bradyrhizobiaceae bacterium]|nr:DUF971 domain-containing protein [Bradyrhizobiaceae bacterium]